MAAYIYNCLDCGAEHDAGRRDAKYCPSCRLYRGLVAVRAKFKYRPSCKACGKRFSARHVRDTRLCGPCETESRRHNHPEIDCPVCRSAGIPTDSVNVCLNCCKGENQQRVLRALKKGRATRAADNAEILEAIRRGVPHLRPVDA